MNKHTHTHTQAYMLYIHGLAQDGGNNCAIDMNTYKQIHNHR